MLPNGGALADDICLVRSMHTEAVNHAPGVTLFMTGAQIPGRPSMGAWLAYGLGSETDNLPTFVVMTSSDKGKTCGQLFFDYTKQRLCRPLQGVLPQHAIRCRILQPAGRQLKAAGAAGRHRRHRRAPGRLRRPEIDGIAQYEMAFRMQTASRN
jgi:hypothetical protein